MERQDPLPVASTILSVEENLLGRDTDPAQVMVPWTRCRGSPVEVVIPDSAVQKAVVTRSPVQGVAADSTQKNVVVHPQGHEDPVPVATPFYKAQEPAR